MERSLFLLALSFIFSIASFAQKPRAYGIEGHYGFLADKELNAGARYDMLNKQNSFNLALLVNISLGNNLGDHESEKGKGVGLAFGYRYYFENSGSGSLFAGLRATFWYNRVIWKYPGGGANRGASGTVLFQPGAETGYLAVFGKNKYFSPTITYGYAINLSNTGKPVYVMEGSKLLFGASLGILKNSDFNK